MSKILFLYETEMPTVSITRNFWSKISCEYHIATRFVMLVNLKTYDLNWCNILILIRPNNSLSWRIAKSVRDSGRFTITMCDDDLLNLPNNIPDLPWQRKGLIKALKYSSVILSSSQHIISQMKCLTADCRGVQTDTVVKKEDLVIRRYDNEKNKCVKIVYAAGGNGHEIMFEKYVLPALRRIAIKHPFCFSLTLVSVKPNCEDLDRYAQIRFVNNMPLLEYREYMEREEFDIGVAPLKNDSFNRCKYYNKYIEYSISGVLGIYSNVEPYIYVVKDCSNGLLASNSIDSWEKKLNTAIVNSSLREECSRNAQKHVIDVFSEKSVMNRLFIDIPELKNAINNSAYCSEKRWWFLEYRVKKCFEYIYKFFFYLKKQGVISVINKLIARAKKQILSFEKT